MADEVTLVLGFTANLRNGTAVSQNDTETNPIPFSRVGEVVDVGYRGPLGKASTTALVVRCPAGVQASFDGGLTFSDVATGPGVVTDKNQAFKLKQTAGAGVGVNHVNITIDALSWQAVAEAPELSAIPSITPSDTSAVISATAFDPNGDVPTILYRIVARGATPNWTGAPSLTGYNPGSVTASGLTGGTDYDLYLRTQDAGGLYNTYGPYPFTTNVVVPDTTSPTWPTGAGLGISQHGAGTLRAAWNAAADNVAVTSYSLERSDNGTTGWAVIATPTALYYDDSGLGANTTKYYRVRARDAAGNWSDYSSVANGTSAAISWTDDGKLLADPFTHADTTSAASLATGAGTWTAPNTPAASSLQIAANKLRLNTPAGMQYGIVPFLSPVTAADAIIQLKTPNMNADLREFGLLGRWNYGGTNGNTSTGWYSNHIAVGTQKGSYLSMRKTDTAVQSVLNNTTDSPTVAGGDLMMLSMLGTGATAITYWRNGNQLYQGPGSGTNFVTTGTLGLWFGPETTGAQSIDIDNFVAMKPLTTTVPCGIRITNLPSGYYAMVWDGTNYVKSAVGTGTGNTDIDCHTLDFTAGDAGGVTVYFHNGDPGTTYNNAATLQSGMTQPNRYSGAVGVF